MGKIKKLLRPYVGLPKAIYILFISKIINSIGCFVQPLLALILTNKIGLGKDVAGSYVTILILLTVPSLILGGKLVDSIGRKKIIIISQGFGALSIIACGFIRPNMLMTYMLILSAFLYGLSSPAYDAMLADLTTPETRKGAYSLLYMGWNLGFAIGPIIGGFLYKSYLSLLFIGDGVTTILSLLLVIYFISETKGKDKNIEVDENRELEKDVEGSVFKVLLSRPILIYYALIFMCYQFEYSQWAFALPIQLGDMFKDMGGAYYGILASFNGLIVIIFTPVVSTITHSFKPIRVVALGGLCYGISFGMLAFAKVLLLFFIAIFIMTVGEILISINSSAFIANHTPASHRGRVNAVLPLIFGTGFTFGPMIMGRFISVYSVAKGWILIGALGIISALLMELLERADVKNKEITA